MRLGNSLEIIAIYLWNMYVLSKGWRLAAQDHIKPGRAGLTLVRRGLASITLLLALTLPAAAAEVNIALNKTVTPLTNVVQGAPGNVVDGSYSTFWYSYQSGDYRISFTLDLGSVTDFDAIRLKPLQCRNFVIESSTDNMTWTTRHSESFAYNDNDIRDITIDTPYQARYLRYTATNNDTAWAGLVEFEVLVEEAVAFAGGDGSPEDPWQVSTPAQLDSLRDYLGPDYADSHFVLVNDIDLDVAPYNVDPGWEPIGSYAGWESVDNEPFSGAFDGNSHTISGLFIDRPATDGVGLFGFTDGATIENLILAEADVTGDLYIGALTGLSYNTAITSVVTSGAVLSSGGGRGGGLAGMVFSSRVSGCSSSCVVDVTNSTNAGGLVGQMEDFSIIEDSFASGKVTCAQDLAGGLVGEVRYNSSIVRSYATGNVTSDGYTGGLTGDLAHGSSIADSYATGSVDGGNGGSVGGLAGRTASSDPGAPSSINASFASGDVSGANRVGGLVGNANASSGGTIAISNSYATGAATGLDGVGGLIGNNGDSVTLTNCYAAGPVTAGSSLGGLAGISSGNVVNSYYDAQTSGQTDTGKGEGLTSAEMKQQSSFDGWDFPVVWKIAEMITYPYLSWQSLETIGGVQVETVADDGSEIRGGFSLVFGADDNDRTTVLSKIADPFIEEIAGEQQIVLRVDMDGQLRAIVATGPDGTSRTWYEVYDVQGKQWFESSATLPAGAMFPGGSQILIEDGDDGLQLTVETSMTDNIQF